MNRPRGDASRCSRSATSSSSPTWWCPLFVGRPKSIQALEDAMAGDRQLVVAAQRVAGDEDPTPEDIYDDRHARHDHPAAAPARRNREGPGRGPRPAPRSATSRPSIRTSPSRSRELPGREGGDTPEAEALVRSIHTTFESYAKLNKKIAPETRELDLRDQRRGQALGHGRRPPEPEAARSPEAPRGARRPSSVSKRSTTACRRRSRCSRSSARSVAASRSRWSAPRRSTT